MPSAAPPTSHATSHAGSEGIQALFAWQTACFDSLVQAQCIQLQALAAWQRSCFAVNQELRDQWVARFGGGVPLDG